MFFIDLYWEKKVEAAGRKTDRFDYAKFTEYLGDFHEPVTSHVMRKIKEMSKFGSFKVVTEEKRPDLISYKIYGTTQLWWVILLYNNIFSNEEIVNPMNLNYPSLSDLEKLYYALPGLAKQ